ncbi:MAG: hypothetical protein HOQ05_13550 [Corynebacteriales bacterium]|nr:hypothetical protein [Mycobacteriales bacterium]
MKNDLAESQRALIAALVGEGPPLAGLSGQVGFEAARAALLRKRMGSVRRAWPLLPTCVKGGFEPLFAQWASHNPVRGGFIDGFRFAAFVENSGRLSPVGRRLLAEQRVFWRDDGQVLHRRRLLAMRFAAGGLFVQVLGRRWSLSVIPAGHN